jgi:hypothetical protein
MDSYSYHITKWDPQPIVGGSWARVHPDPLNYNTSNLVNGIVWFNIKPNYFILIDDGNLEDTIRI